MTQITAAEGVDWPDPLPTSVGESIALLEVARVRRQTFEEGVRAAKGDETILQDHIRLLMREQGITFTRGSAVSVKVEDITIPKATDWPALYNYIVTTNSFDLLHRRLTIPAFRDRWSDGEKIPGVAAETIQKLTVRKL